MKNQVTKIAILFDPSNSSWVSCNSILTNILLSYELTGFNVHKLFFSNDMETADIRNLAKEITEQEFTHIVIADHRITISTLLKEIYKKATTLPIIITHIYGDFFLNRNYWASIDSLLRNFQVQFICASTAQTQFVKNFLNANQAEAIIQTISFPVADELVYSKKQRIPSRKNYALSSEDFVLCYSGRVSLQKNVLDLISTFSFLVEFIPHLKLLIAGPFDDIGIPYIGLSRRPLTMEHEFYMHLESLYPETRSKIIYAGNLNQGQLLEFYHAADMYMSYSTHNDEDFGMAPAEALCLGLPLLLTNWGGYFDFKKNIPKMVDLIDVEIQIQKIKPQSATVKQKTLAKLLHRNHLTDEERSNYSVNAKKLYSPLAISLQLKQVITSRVDTFAGFNSLFFSTVEVTNTQSPFQDQSNGFSKLYKQLYDCHFNKG